VYRATSRGVTRNSFVYYDSVSVYVDIVG